MLLISGCPCSISIAFLLSSVSKKLKAHRYHFSNRTWVIPHSQIMRTWIACTGVFRGKKKCVLRNALQHIRHSPVSNPQLKTSCISIHIFCVFNRCNSAFILWLCASLSSVTIHIVKKTISFQIWFSSNIGFISIAISNIFSSSVKWCVRNSISNETSLLGE